VFRESGNLWIITFLVAVLIITGGCRQQGTEPRTEEGTAAVDYTYFRVGMPEEIYSLDPVEITTYGEMLIARTLYDTLFTLEADTERLVPLLVEHWEVSPDGQTYIFRLRRGIKFHSGRELTAEDVRFSWQRLVARGAPGEITNALMVVQGARNYLEGRTGQISGLEITDPYTIQVTLERPYQQFLLALAHPQASIVDMEVVQLVGEKYGEPGTFQSPVVVLAGTGPFSIVEWIGGYQVTLQVFDQYHGEAAQIDRLEFSQYPDPHTILVDFQAGHLDVVITSGDLTQPELPEKGVLPIPATDLYYLGINPKLKPFDNPLARQAVSLSIQRGVLAGENQGVPLESLLPRSLLQDASPRVAYTYDTQQANRLLQNEEGESILQQPLTLTIPEGEKWRLLAQDIQTQLEEAGIPTELRNLSQADFKHTIRNGQTSFFLDHWQSGLPTPEFFLENHFASWGLANNGGVANPLVDDRLLFVQTAADTERERLANFLEIEELVQGEAVLISLFSTRRYVIFQEHVKGVQLLPGGLVAWEQCYRLP
jgi:oligopeptide transport system substrate-binding protein